MSTATAPAPAVFFAASTLTASGFQALRATPPAHPSRYTFADDASARNYERELKGLPFPDGSSPIVMIVGENFLRRSALIRALIELRHGDRAPRVVIPGSERHFERHLRAAIANGDSYLWILADHFHSHALAAAAAANPRLRLYCSAPAASLSNSLIRLSRLIRISA